MTARLSSLGDSFLPIGARDPQHLRQLRASILQSLFGLLFTVVFGLLYGLSGSPWSGAAIAPIGLSLAAVPFAIRRGVSTVVVGNFCITLTYLATFVVASRSGGFTSPAIVWCFLFPLCTYVACGAPSALIWAALSSLQLSLFFLADLAGVAFPQDFSSALLSMLRVSSYAGVIFATVMVLFVVNSVRVASERAIERAHQALERERILGDMHDGVGSQLLGLILQARAGTLPNERVVTGLESCLDDVRLIVNSLDPVDHPLETALGELRARVQPRCDAAVVQLEWSCEVARIRDWSPGATLQVLRTVQELLTNALRHARARRIMVTASVVEGPQPLLQVEVVDDGEGFDLLHPPHAGRGLKSLRARARKLAGVLEIARGSPGTRVTLRCPLDQPRGEPAD